MRRQVAWALLGLTACAPDPAADAGTGWQQGAAYVADPAVGRAALEAAVVDSTNEYSALRLTHYRPEAWGALPEWRPRLARVRPGERAGAVWEEAPETVPTDAERWRALGAWAFETWPAQIDTALHAAVDTPSTAEAAGLFPNENGELPMVWVEVSTGPVLAYTCATCHRDDGQARFDERALHTGHPSQGAGRVDVTADGRDNPTTLTDLRPVRWQTHLHRTATLRNGLVSLAVRIETLLITHADGHRPPRVIAFALAWYLWTLADTLPPMPEGPGAAIFARTCAGCHQGEALAGPAVPLEALAPLSPAARAIGESPDRGTGQWRVPSLRGVGSRRPLLASGEVPDLAALVDPARGGPHAFGQALPAAERAELLAWLSQL